MSIQKRRTRRAALIILGVSLMCASASSAALDQTDPPVSYGSKFEEQDGAALYRGVCQACHMAEGQGAQGAAAYPALKANPRLAGAAYPVYNVLHGRHGMPPVGELMTDDQVAAVVNYVRSHFDNHYQAVVSAEEVHQLR